MNIPDILQYMGVIERPRTIRILQLASKFIAVWFAAAGAVHLLENSGDFFCDFCNGQEIDLPNTVYFMIITMTTVNERCSMMLDPGVDSRLVMVISPAKHIQANTLSCSL